MSHILTFMHSKPSSQGSNRFLEKEAIINCMVYNIFLINEKSLSLVWEMALCGVGGEETFRDLTSQVCPVSTPINGT